MNSKDINILQSLLKLYISMYDSKELFNKAYFKYSPAEVMKVINSLTNEEKKNPKKKQKKIRNEILSINTEEDVANYYFKNLQYKKIENSSKEELLKNISLDELKHLYKNIYSTPIRPNIRKNELLNLISKYFDSIERVRAMKP